MKDNNDSPFYFRLETVLNYEDKYMNTKDTHTKLND